MSTAPVRPYREPVPATPAKEPATASARTRPTKNTPGRDESPRSNGTHPMASIKLAVLVSGSGTTLQNLLDVIAAGQLDAQIKLVIGSRTGIQGIERAAGAKIMNFVVQRGAFDDCGEFSRQVFSLCDDAGADLVCLGGWLCLLDIPARYQGKVMNIHPALLPSFGGKGMFG